MDDRTRANMPTSLPTRFDEFCVRFLPWVAAVPALAFLVTPALQVEWCVRVERYSYRSWELYYVIIRNYAEPVVKVGALLTAAMVLWLLFRGYRRPSRGRVTLLVPFFVMAALMVVSTLANPENEYRFTGIQTSFVGLWSHLLFVFGYWWPSSLVKPRNVRRALIAVFCAVSVAVAVYGWWKVYVVGADEEMQEIYQIAAIPDSIFFNYNFYGYFLSISVPLSAAMFTVEHKAWWKVFYLLSFVANTVMLNLNNTLGAWLACAVVLMAMPVVWRFFRGRWNSSAVAMFVLFFVIFSMVSSHTTRMVDSIGAFWGDLYLVITSFFGPRAAQAAPMRVFRALADAGSADDAALMHAGSGRWKLWVETCKYIAERPLLGWGAEGCWQRLYEETELARAHCEQLMYANFFGIPAAVAYCWGCIAPYVRAWRQRCVEGTQCLDGVSAACLAAALGYFISSTFGNTMFYTTPLFYIFLGLGLVGFGGHNMIDESWAA